MNSSCASIHPRFQHKNVVFLKYIIMALKLRANAIVNSKISRGDELKTLFVAFIGNEVKGNCILAINLGTVSLRF